MGIAANPGYGGQAGGQTGSSSPSPGSQTYAPSMWSGISASGWGWGPSPAMQWGWGSDYANSPKYGYGGQGGWGGPVGGGGSSIPAPPDGTDIYWQYANPPGGGSSMPAPPIGGGGGSSMPAPPIGGGGGSSMPAPPIGGSYMMAAEGQPGGLATGTMMANRPPWRRMYINPYRSRYMSPRPPQQQSGLSQPISQSAASVGSASGLMTSSGPTQTEREPITGGTDVWTYSPQQE